MSDITGKILNVKESEEVHFEAEALSEGETEATKKLVSNEYLRGLMNRNFLEYASYVIKDRAIPDVDDGLKPVQRRILWAMHRVDDGRTNKASFVVGEVMGKYHPHGDASIKDALVVLANKEYFIEKQGNFGNILSGSNAAAPRYIECGLTPLAREVLFNDDITEMVDTYDGRNQEPYVLPVKIPSLLMLGSDGIAVGMATKIMPHNFNELLQAQIAILRHEEFQLYPDFLQGGLMDVREYADGNGKITLRAKIEIDGRRLIIREIPATTTTESLIASIEKAAERNKIKITSVNDYTTKDVEIEIIPTRGYDPEKALQALYMYTDCSVPISVNLMVIKENRPCLMTVRQVVERNTEKLLEYLQLELEIALNKQNELFHAKTLAQIFFENRIYKRIEECRGEGEEYIEVRTGLEPFLDQLRRELTNEDIDKLLALPVRRIARFDIEKNQRELREIEGKIAEINKYLKKLTQYAITYLEDLLKKYGHLFPRHTEIEHLEKIDRRSAALNNVKIGWDRKNGYIGTAIKSDEVITCTEFDRILMVERNGKYKVAPIPPEKLFVGRLYECRKYDPAQQFGVVYFDQKTKKYYGKRSVIDKFITDKEYMLCPKDCRLELFTPRADAIYDMTELVRKTKRTSEFNLMTMPLRSSRARGILITGNTVDKWTHKRYLDEAELAAFTAQEIIPAEEDDTEEEPVAVALPPQPEPIPVPVPETEPEPESKVMPEPKRKSAPKPKKVAAAPPPSAEAAEKIEPAEVIEIVETVETIETVEVIEAVAEVVPEIVSPPEVIPTMEIVETVESVVSATPMEEVVTVTTESVTIFEEILSVEPEQEKVRAPKRQGANTPARTPVRGNPDDDDDAIMQLELFQ